ncbi:MAG TPA: TonB-dependent hemoglobin/transferrin/lactoferrin family receptor, partial [Stenotrophomonas sp.]|nr:TonB-dependent hemoglobin/transferrin/lactoferrin family receptor [Stenotrophomonas sp.]
QTQRLRLTVDANEDSVDTNVLSSVTPATALPPASTATTSMKARDHQTRARVSLAHEMDQVDRGFADSLSWQVYRQDSETTQRTVEGRGNGST